MPSPTVPSSLLQMWRELKHCRADAAHPFDREPSPDNADRDRERVMRTSSTITRWQRRNKKGQVV
jgi:anti-sigma factor RsiW